MPRFDWASVGARADDDLPLSALLSPITRNLVIDALQFMLPRWAWGAVDDATWDEIDAAVSGALKETNTNMLVGVVYWRAGDPQFNELVCDGTQYQRVNFPDLYAAIDPFFIVDADNFVVPDLMDRFVMGAGGDAAMGDTGGAEEVTLTVDQIPAHSHTVDPHTHTYTPPVLNLDLESPGAPDIFGAGLGLPEPTGSASPGTSSVGGDEPHENRPPYLALTPVIVAY